MRFKTFLTEDYKYDFSQVLQEIRAHCSDFLEKAGPNALVRGIPKRRVSGTEVTELNMTQASWWPHPENRKPKDSADTEGFNFLINGMIDAGFGIENIRSKSLFVSGVTGRAHEYGAIHFVFPAGQMKYLWSTKIEDAYEDSRKLMMPVHLEFGEQLKLEHPLTPENMRHAFGYLEKHEDVKSWLDNGYSESEQKTLDALQATCNEHETVEELEHKSKSTNIHDELVAAMKYAAKSLYTDGKNLPKAIKTGNEIMVYKSSGHYLIPADMVYEEMMKRKLRITDRWSYDEMYQFLYGLLSHSAPGGDENQEAQ